MDQSENILLGVQLGYLNSKYEVSTTGMQALVINSCAAEMAELSADFKPIDILNNYAALCYNNVSKSKIKKSVTLADFRNIIYNIALGAFPAYTDETIYCICENSLIVHMVQNNRLIFSKMKQDIVPILLTQIEQARKEMTELQGEFDDLINIAKKGNGCPFGFLLNYYEYFELFSDHPDSDMLRGAYLYDIGYIAGKRAERARRKKAELNITESIA